MVVVLSAGARKQKRMTTRENHYGISSVVSIKQAFVHVRSLRKIRNLVAIRLTPGKIIDRLITKRLVANILPLHHERKKQKHPKDGLPDPRTADHKNAMDAASVCMMI